MLALAINVPRRSNLLAFPEDLSNAAWVKTRTTIETDVAIAPDGASTADNIVSTAVSGTHTIRQSVALAAKYHTISAHAKIVSGFTQVQFQFDDGVGNNAASGVLALATGTWGSSSQAGTTTIVGRGFTSLPDDWYRVWFTVKIGTAATTSHIVYAAGGANVITDKLSVWGVMCEPFPNMSVYPPV